MATKYWVGGDGNWSSLTNWRTTSGGAVITTAPGSADAAVLDANSSTSIVTVDSNITIQTLTCTGFTGTLAFGTNTISLNSTGTIFTGATTMTVTGTPLIICTNSSATSRTITPGAVTEANSISFRFTAGTGAIALTAGSYRDLDFTDGTNPTGYGGALSGTTITVYGNFKASTGMTQTAGTQVLTFGATSGTKTINTAAVVFDRPFTFSGVGGTWQLVSALTSGATRTATLTAGTLDLNGYTLTTGLFSSNNSNTRSIAFGTGNITVIGNATTVWSCSTLTNFSYTGTPTVNFTYSGSTGTRVVSNGNTAGATESNAVDFNVVAGGDIFTMSNFCSVRNFTVQPAFTGSTGMFSLGFIYGNLLLSPNQTYLATANQVTFAATSGTKTITTNGVTIDRPLTFDGVGGTWVCQDALTLGSTRTLTMTNGTLQLAARTTSTVGMFATSGTNQKYLQSSTAGTQATISQASGTIDVSYLTIKDINATGGATWNAFLTNQNVNGGNNTGWDFYLQFGKYIYTRRKNKRILL